MYRVRRVRRVRCRVRRELRLVAASRRRAAASVAEPAFEVRVELGASGSVGNFVDATSRKQRAGGCQWLPRLRGCFRR